jgi:hypothetical protein
MCVGGLQMSELDYVMMIHISHIVLEEHRPFSYLDFLQFTVDKKEHKIAHSTFRNKVSRLRRDGRIETAYKSSILLYFKRNYNCKASDT